MNIQGIPPSGPFSRSIDLFRDYAGILYFIRDYIRIVRASVDSNTSAIRAKILLETRNTYCILVKTFQSRGRARITTKKCRKLIEPLHRAIEVMGQKEKSI